MDRSLTLSVYFWKHCSGYLNNSSIGSGWNKVHKGTGCAKYSNYIPISPCSESFSSPLILPYCCILPHYSGHKTPLFSGINTPSVVLLSIWRYAKYCNKYRFWSGHFLPSSMLCWYIRRISRTDYHKNNIMQYCSIFLPNLLPIELTSYKNAMKLQAGQYKSDSLLFMPHFQG